jgi:photosystem II stability/assembly factor-like uncharacterized protein
MKNLVKLLVIWFALIFVSVALAQSWTTQYSGLQSSLNTKQLYFVAIDENTCWAAHLHDMSGATYIRTTNGGTNWIASSIPDASSLIACNMTATDANNAWIAFDSTSGSTTSSGIFRTTNGGVSWTKQIAAKDPMFVYFFDNSNGLVVGKPQGGYWAIYTTTNGGEAWSRVPSSNIPSPISGETIEPGGAPCGFGNSFWFASILGNGSLYRTTDKGLTWGRSTAIQGAVGMAVAFENELVGLVSSDSPAKFRHTTDGGQTFSDAGSLNGITYHYLTAIPGSPGAYIMTNFDLFGWLPGSAYTLNGGQTWNVIDNVNHGRNDFVSPTCGWSGGGNDSLYKYTGIPLPVDEEINSTQPDKFSLAQNYPNPFNPSTKISWQSSVSSWQTLKVYDVLGNEVATLVDEYKPAGNYEVKFSADGLTSGIYFYKLQAGSFGETKKMILMR